MERTEEDKLVQAPLVVILGGKEYRIKPLVIRESREWRKKVTSLITTYPQLLAVTSDNPSEFSETLERVLVEMPDQIIDLFFEYGKELKREEIEGIATDEEIAQAFEGMVEIAFPLARSLPGAITRLSQ